MSKRHSKLSDLDIDPHMVDRELRQFHQTAKTVASKVAEDRRLAGKWVAGYHGKVVASGGTMDSVFDALERKGIPKEKAVVFFAEKGDRALIL